MIGVEVHFIVVQHSVARIPAQTYYKINLTIIQLIT